MRWEAEADEECCVLCGMCESSLVLAAGSARPPLTADNILGQLGITEWALRSCATWWLPLRRMKLIYAANLLRDLREGFEEEQNAQAEARDQ